MPELQSGNRLAAGAWEPALCSSSVVHSATFGNTKRLLLLQHKCNNKSAENGHWSICLPFWVEAIACPPAPFVDDVCSICQRWHFAQLVPIANKSLRLLLTSWISCFTWPAQGSSPERCRANDQERLASFLSSDCSHGCCHRFLPSAHCFSRFDISCLSHRPEEALFFFFFIAFLCVLFVS